MRDFIERQKAALSGQSVIIDYGVDKCPALEVQYYGPEASCEMKVATDGDLSSEIGDVGSLANDTTFAITSASYSTLDKMKAAVNAVPYYRAICHALPNIDPDDALLVQASGQQIKKPESYKCLLDHLVLPQVHFSISARDFSHCEAHGDAQYDWDERGHVSRLHSIQFDVTDSTWGVTVKIYNVRGAVVDDEVLQLPVTVSTGVLQQSSMLTIFGTVIKAKPGHRLVVVLMNTTDWFDTYTLGSIVGDII